MALGIAMIAWFPHWPGRIFPAVHQQPAVWYSLVAVLGLWMLRRCLGALLDPRPKSVQRAVSFGVLYIVTLDSLACYAAAGPYWAILILLLLAPAMVLAAVDQRDVRGGDKETRRLTDVNPLYARPFGQTFGSLSPCLPVSWFPGFPWFLGPWFRPDP